MIEYTTVAAMYSGDPTVYTFLCKMELAEKLVPQDKVVAKSARGLGVVMILDVHDVPRDTGNFNYRWVFQKVDTDEIAELEKAQLNKDIKRASEAESEPEDVAAIKAAVGGLAPKKPPVKIPSVPKL